ncbi:MAG: HDIG domain-containing protein [Candidatus Woesearchaeota archaeon]|nr:HDIG domain-containing protein [Candidatus Woesearchaeota archaeon]
MDVKGLFEENIRTDNIRLHCIEVEAVMAELAKEFGGDDGWSVAGLLHDLDFEEVKDLENHGKKTVEILKKEGFPEDVVRAVASHNEAGTGVKRESKMDFALAAADNISGLIFAYALMRKTIVGMDVAGLKKRLKDKRFAANCNRDKIFDIEKAGIPLDKFLEVSIKAMQGIAGKIGLQ